MNLDDLNDFLGNIDDSNKAGVLNGEEEDELVYETVEDFDFHNTDPLDEKLLEFHHPQLNWLLRELGSLKSVDGRGFDRVEERNKELQGVILELVRSAKTSEKEGNQWRAEYEAQADLNRKIGDDILRMTDRVEHIKGLLSNSDNLFQEFDGYSEMKWRKLLRKVDKDLKQKEATMRDLEQRLVEEIKAFTKHNHERSRLLADLGVMTTEEVKQLIEIEKQKDELLEAMEREKANPSPRKNILEEFKNRKQKIEDRKKQEKDYSERAETAGSRHGGRFTGRITPRGGTMNLAKGAKVQRDLRETETDPFLRRGVYGNRIAVDRRGGPDPVAALFSQSMDPMRFGTGVMNSGNITGNDDDYTEFLTTPRNMNLSMSGNLPEDKRIIDASRGPVKKSTAIRNLPKL